MKIKLIIFICLFTVTQVFSQTFKEVKTVQDVIDNYIEAAGGEDALSNVKSVYMKGEISGGAQQGSIEAYLGKRYIYLNVDVGVFKMIQSADLKKKTGWTMFGTSMKDMAEDDINKNIKNAEVSLWSYYLNPEKYGIKYELMQNEEVAGKDAYVVDLIQNEAVLLTAYFDSKTFNKVKQIKGNDNSEFSDFRSVGDDNVKMPFMINGKNGDVTISEIKINSKFNKDLLKKPEVEK